MKRDDLQDGVRVRDGWTPARAAAVWDRVTRAQQRRETTRTAGVALGFFCLAAFAAGGIAAIVRSHSAAIVALAGDEADESSADEPPPPAAADDVERAPEVGPGERRLRFRDGSVAILRSPRTVLEPVSIEARRIVSILRVGAARFEITKRPSRLFRIVAGVTTVEVLGTKFELERLGARLRVTVTEGQVRVSWPGGERRLGRGEGGVFPPEPLARRRRTAVARDAAQPAALVELPRPPAPAAPAAATPAPAARAESSRADDELAGLLRTADRARAAGRSLDAASALRAAIALAPADPRAPLAEFRLGRLLLEDVGKPLDAAAAFARARALAPEGPLVPDALAREIEARAAGGERATARTLARLYLARYPNGSHAAWVRRWGAPD